MNETEPALEKLFTTLKARDYSSISVLPAPLDSTVLTRWVKRILFPLSDQEPHRLFRPSRQWRSEYAAFKRRDPDLFLLFNAFVANEAILTHELKRCLGSLCVDDLFNAGYLRTDGPESCLSDIRVIPYQDMLLVTDRWDRGIPDFTYLGGDSIECADFLNRYLGVRRFTRGVDIGAGSGIQALVSASRCDEFIAADINPRALDYVRLNAGLNDIPSLTTHQGDFKTQLTGQFDLIVSNPPFRLLPDDERDSNRDGFGGELGIEFTLDIVRALPKLLRNDGEAVITSIAPVVAGENVLLKRLTILGQSLPYKIEMRVVDIAYPIAYRELYRLHNIKHLHPCILIVKPADTFSLVVREQIQRRRTKELVIGIRRRWG